MTVVLFLGIKMEKQQSKKSSLAVIKSYKVTRYRNQEKTISVETYYMNKKGNLTERYLGDQLMEQFEYDEYQNKTMEIQNASDSSNATKYIYENKYENGVLIHVDGKSYYHDRENLFTVDYSYDDAGYCIKEVKRSGEKDTETVKEYVYEGETLVRETSVFPDGIYSKSTQYEYDEANRVKRQTNVNNKDEVSYSEYTYNDETKTVRRDDYVLDADGKEVLQYYVVIEYDSRGNVLKYSIYDNEDTRLFYEVYEYKYY